MEGLIAAQNAAEDAAAELLEETVAPVVEEWALLTEEDPADMPAAPVPPTIVKELVVYSKKHKKFTAPWLKELHEKLGIQPKLPKSATKEAVFNAIRDSSHVTKIDEKTFEYQYEFTPEHLKKGPKWMVMVGKEIELPSGFAPSGVEEGFFAPTNKENATGKPKLSYLTDDPIKRPEFCKKPTKSKSKQPVGRPSTAANNNPPNIRGGPSEFARAKLPKDFSSHRPKDYFDLQLTPEFLKKNMVDTTNFRAAAEGAGKTSYENFVPFTLEEMYKWMGLLFVNALSPKPQVKFWFKSVQESKIFGNDAFANAFDISNKFTGAKIKGIDRWKHLRRFLCFYDARVRQDKNKPKDPLWKVASLLEELRKNCERCWVTGKFVAIDEQTIGFKGKHGLSLRITYKREGDGYQCDALCEDGYTFSFYFRHGDAPDVPDELKHLNLSPTARRVVYLLMKLPNMWTNCFMDNLFNSRKLYTAAYIVGQLCQGVTRTNGRGICDEVVMTAEVDPKKAEARRGESKCAVYMDDPDCPNLVCVSVYDTKPVHILSTIATHVDWKTMTRDVYAASEGKCVPMKYLRLTLIDEYNNFMNAVDLADQLRNHYRFNHWLRNRKWWWSIFLWALGVATTNAFKMYERLYEEERAKKVPMCKKWSHLEFLQELVYDFMGWETDAKSSGNDGSVSASTTRRGSSYSCQSQVSAQEWNYDLTTKQGREDWFSLNPPDNITKSRMRGTHFSCRMDGKFHPFIPAISETNYCQYCRYKYQHVLTETQQAQNKTMKANKSRIERCVTCKVNLCWSCRLEWHGQGLGELGRKLARTG